MFLCTPETAAVVMSLIQSARLNGHDPYVYLKDALTRLPAQPASRLEELLPHRWHRPSSDLHRYRQHGITVRVRYAGDEFDNEFKEPE